LTFPALSELAKVNDSSDTQSEVAEWLLITLSYSEECLCSLAWSAAAVILPPEFAWAVTQNMSRHFKSFQITIHLTFLTTSPVFPKYRKNVVNNKDYKLI
jgi:hypothetical protein